MSHTATLEVKIKDRNLLAEVARRLGLKVIEDETVKLYQTSHRGTAVYLPGWRYPVVVEADGKLYYDNYNGRWGNIKELHKLQNAYGAELVKREARKRGLSVYEKTEADGTIVLEVRQ